MPCPQPWSLLWLRPRWAQAARHLRLSESGASARLRLRLSGRLAGPPGAEAERPQAEPAGPPRARASGSLWVAQGPGRSVDHAWLQDQPPLAAAGPGADSFRPPSAGLNLAEPSSGADMRRGLVASPAARLATTATASDGPQGHLHPLSSLRFWSDWTQRTCNRLGDIRRFTTSLKVATDAAQPQ